MKGSWKSLIHATVTAVLGILVAILGLNADDGEKAQLESDFGDAQECVDYLLLDLDTTEDWGNVIDNEACRAVIDTAARNAAAFYEREEFGNE